MASDLASVALAAPFEGAGDRGAVYRSRFREVGGDVGFELEREVGEKVSWRRVIPSGFIVGSERPHSVVNIDTKTLASLRHRGGDGVKIADYYYCRRLFSKCSIIEMLILSRCVIRM